MAVPELELVHSDGWLDRVGEGFARALLREDLSPKTVRTYGTGIKDLFAYLRDQRVDDIHYLTRELLEGWQDHLRERVPALKASSRGLYVPAARQFIRFAADHDLVDLKLERALVGVRTKRKTSDDERQPISEEDLQRLMAYLGPRRPRMTLIDLRDRALFFFFLETGLRVSEALQVQRTAYQRARVRQKGGSYVEFEITPSVAAFVGDYLRARTDELPWLWIAIGNNTGQTRQLADSGVREIWRKLCHRLGIERFTTHQLRHTAATILLEQGVDHLAVSKHLHHADTRTVHKYAHVRAKTRQRTLDVMEGFIHDGAHIAPELLARRSPPGGRPRYR